MKRRLSSSTHAGLRVWTPLDAFLARARPDVVLLDHAERSIVGTSQSFPSTQNVCDDVIVVENSASDDRSGHNSASACAPSPPEVICVEDDFILPVSTPAPARDGSHVVSSRSGSARGNNKRGLRPSLLMEWMARSKRQSTTGNSMELATEPCTAIVHVIDSSENEHSD